MCFSLLFMMIINELAKMAYACDAGTAKEDRTPIIFAGLIAIS